MRSRAAAAVALLASALLIVGIAAGASPTTLPGGTALTVGITSPTNGAVLPEGPVAVTGDASIGTAAPVARTGIVVVLDVSGSTSSLGACGGNQNPAHDSLSNSTLDCELAAAKELNDAAALAGTVGHIAFVPFASTAASADLAPAAGAQTSVAPGADFDAVLASAFLSTFGPNPCPSPSTNDGVALFTPACVGTGTNYADALTETATLLSTMTEPNKLVVFMSDGAANLGGPIAGPLSTIHVPAYTFSIGASASCPLNPSGLGSLQQIANATGGTCTDVNTPADLANLPNLIPAVIASQLRQVTLAADGGLPLDLSSSTTPVTLPHTGPISVNWTHTYTGLAPGSHEFCAASFGSDGGGSGSADQCVTIRIDAAPTDVSATGGSGVEGSAIPISGAYTDPDGPDTVAWSYAPGTGVDPGATCSFGDASQASTGITCTDDGTYDLTFTVNDGVNPAQTATASVTVSNAAPSASIAPVPGMQLPGVSVPLSASFTDAGANDTHTCSFSSSGPSGPGAVTESGGNGTCTGALTFAVPGNYTVTVTVTDDDGGVGTASTHVLVDAPPSCSAATATPDTLWPPNHKFATISVSVPDPDAGDTASVHIDGVTQDEPVLGTGSGDTAPDARSNAAAGKVDVRSERSGSGDGRVYRIAFTATDTFGASCSGVVTVGVPHDQSGPAAVAGPGAWVDSFGS